MSNPTVEDVEEGAPSVVQDVAHAHKVMIVHQTEGNGLVAEVEHVGESEGHGEGEHVEDGESDYAVSDHSDGHSIGSEFADVAGSDWPATLADNILKAMEAKGLELTGACFPS